MKSLTRFNVSYMRANVLLNLLNEVLKNDTIRCIAIPFDQDKNIQY